MVRDVNKGTSDNPISPRPNSKAHPIILCIDKQVKGQPSPRLATHIVDLINDRQRPKSLLNRRLFSSRQKIHVTCKTNLITEPTDLIIKQIRLEQVQDIRFKNVIKQLGIKEHCIIKRKSNEINVITK